MSDRFEIKTGLEVAVVGLAVRVPGAEGAETFWQNLRDGVESITHFTLEELRAAGVPDEVLRHPSYVRSKAVLDGFDTFDARLFEMSPREAEALDPQQRIFLEAVWAALEDAAYDPERFPGPIALYAGMGSNNYWSDHLHRNPKLRGSLTYRQMIHGTGKDYLATRAAYKLHLTGPVSTVQTACSSALVATHLACQALAAGDCDLALAGGVTVRLPQIAGYWYEEGGVGSSDGHCRAFDAEADGTVDGSGVAVVALKRYEDAVEDGDKIHAVVRGTGVANDGGGRIGYTAPSVEGQARAIRAALQVAEIEPESVTYVEGHGAGTPLGDPTEVEALRRALETSASRDVPCALGSVKTNIGHLDAAAGVAGLIKTVLALEHGQIPPSLGFERPNPEIPFEGSRFYVNDELRPWSDEAGPRRAGVSSFGIGGTNAHIVLEEAPQRPAATPSRRGWHLVALSAKSDAALGAAAKGLAEHLEREPELPLADVAYTLGVGRRQLERRQIVVARDGGDAAAALAVEDPTRVFFGTAEKGRRVGFLFAGLGDHHPGMALGLYRREQVFRDVVDHCAEILEPHLGLDLRDELFPDDAEEPSPEAAPADGDANSLRRLLGRDRGSSPAMTGRLAETWLAQPAVFVVDYALAELWRSWGVEPASMVGFSLGEYVAATLAGVFTLEDVLPLVAARAKLINGLEGGAMVAVPLAEEEVTGHLGDGLALAVSAAPAVSVVAGPPAEVARFEERLAAEGLALQRLPTTHAFHSPMMQAAAEPFARRVAEVSMRAPKIPYISNVTGDWIRPEEATDPDYWVRHMCETVRFTEGLEKLLEDSRTVFLEVGPGRTLSSFARHVAGNRHPAIASLRAVDDPIPDDAFLLGALGRLWLAGVDVEWPALYAGESRRRVRLPAYPFERRRYWIEAKEGLGLPGAAEAQDEIGDATRDGTTRETDNTGETDQTGTIRAEAVRDAGLELHERPDLPSRYAPAESEGERELVTIWQDLMGIAPVGLNDNFFELGGHSLLATLLVARVQESFGVALPLRTVSEAPTPAQMLEVIDELRRRRGDDAGSEELPKAVIDTLRRDEPFPMTDIQEAYFIGQNAALELGKVAAHSYRETDNYDVDLERYELAWQRLIERHGMLRAVATEDGSQVILPEVPTFELPILDLRGHDPEEAESELARIRRDMSHQVNDNTTWPLFDIRATLLDGGRTRIHWSINVLILDAWSLQILQLELQKLYVDPDRELPPISLSFRDYVLAERALRETALYRRAESYWTERLPDLPPAPELPMARAPASLDRPRFVRRVRRLDAPAWTRLKEQASRHGLTSTAFLVAAFSEVLAVWSKRPRFTLNLTLYNRLPLHPEVQSLVGDFTSLNLLGVDAATPTFAERARLVQARLWDDLDHRSMSGVRVMRELAKSKGSYSAGFMPVVFTSVLTLTQNAEKQHQAAREEAERAAAKQQAAAGDGEGDGAKGDETKGEKKKKGGLVYGVSQTPQVWIDHQVSEWGGELATNWDVVEDLFPPGLIDAMFESYFDFLGRLAEDEATWDAERTVSLPEADRQLQEKVNATDAPIPAGLLHEPFLERARETPDHPAVIAVARDDGDRPALLTYGELDARSAELARHLRHLGVGPNRLVAVALDKGFEQVVAVLAILRAGAAYLPVDPGLPPERFAHLLDHGEIEVAVTRAKLDGELTWPENVGRLVVDDLPADPGEPDAPAPEVTPEHLAYVIYTSGSTGEPKGVMIDHRGALNTIVDIDERFSIGAEDKVFALSALSFDLSVYDIFGTLTAGGTIVLPSPSGIRDPAHWAALMERHGVTVWDSVPALMVMLAEYLESRDEPRAGTLRLALLSGDWLPVGLPDRLRSLWSQIDVISLGGATEASIWSILYPVGEVDPSWSSIPYGRAMKNQRLNVLDEHLEPCPVWVTGELMIGGIGLAKGYWRDEERTRQSFFVHPRTGERLYRTGDLGRFLPDGEIEFLGRDDLQVKVGGYRIELGEIETALERHAAVRAGAVVAIGDRHGPKRLVGFYVPEDDVPEDDRETIDAGELTAFLAEKLPAYMVPAHLVEVAELPLTSNGKIDRKTLGRRAEKAAAAKPRTSTPVLAESIAARVVQAIRKVLGIDHVDAGANLLELGAASIEMVKLANIFEQEFHFRPKMEKLFELTTVAELVAYFEENVPDEGDRSRETAAGAPPPPPEEIPPWMHLLGDPEERARHKSRHLELLRPGGVGDGAGLTLPAPEPDEAWRRGYLERRSVRSFSAEPLALESLGRLLAVLRRALLDGKPKFRYGSAGGVYPVQAYLYVKPDRVEGVGAGFYYHHPVDHRLQPVAPGEELAESPFGWVNAKGFEEAAFALFLAGEMRAIGPMYGGLARDYSLIEAGLIAQLLESEAPRAGIGLYQVGHGGMDKTTLAGHLDLGDSRVLLHGLLGGPLDDDAQNAFLAEAELTQDWDEGEL